MKRVMSAEYICPKCGSHNVVKKGTVVRKKDGRRFRCIYCKACGKRSRVPMSMEAARKDAIRRRQIAGMKEALEDTKRLKEVLGRELERVFGSGKIDFLQEWIDDLLFFLKRGLLYDSRIFPQENRRRLWKLVKALKKM